MTTDDKKKLLALHRLQQAKESLEEARYLLDGKKSLRSVVNRIYYGMPPKVKQQGWVTMILGAVMHQASSLLVILNSMRLLRKI
jgi:hypothetical protein